MKSRNSRFRPVTPESMEKVAMDIMDWLEKQNMWFEVNILVNGQMWMSDKNGSYEERRTPKGTSYWVKPDIDIKRQLEYSNPDTISITFEGPLYHRINYEDYDFMLKMSEKFLDPYGLYFEQGHAWSMTAYA